MQSGHHSGGMRQVGCGEGVRAKGSEVGRCMGGKMPQAGGCMVTPRGEFSGLAGGNAPDPEGTPVAALIGALRLDRSRAQGAPRQPAVSRKAPLNAWIRVGPGWGRSISSWRGAYAWRRWI